MEVKNLKEFLENSFNGEILWHSVTSLIGPGENYGSVMLKIDAKIKSHGGEQIVHAVAKCMPPSKVIQDTFNLSFTFKNEICWYTSIIPTMQKFQSENGAQNIIDFFPTMYGARTSLDSDKDIVDDDGVLLLENLKESGFENEDRRRGFDIQTAKEIVKKLAVFHSVAVAIKIKNPELFEAKIHAHLYGAECSDDSTSGLQDCFKYVIKLLQEDSECKVLLDRVKPALALNPWGLRHAREPWAGVVHLDLWTNNIMVKKQENDTKVMFLDLQAGTYASITADLIIFVTTSVKFPDIEVHMDDLIKLYYSTFIDNLKEFGVDTTPFSYDSFLEELKTEASCGQYGRCISLVFAALGEKEDVNDLTGENYDIMDDLKKMASRMTDAHRKRYKFITVAFAERGWL
ncbi:uncharacterized protein LOC132705405 [Cylas formicarius]|uniref:uncharacterized protein LOC132705405 n=1 Tax=Cylas formicarius TaxID=197179 RepID=UPI00295842F0|nr:uncharacterized protein LOC132705405 [Cylas formicarius]